MVIKVFFLQIKFKLNLNTTIFSPCSVLFLKSLRLLRLLLVSGFVCLCYNLKIEYRYFEASNVIRIKAQLPSNLNLILQDE